MEQIVRIRSIDELHHLLQFESPKHPLITLVDLNKISAISDYNNKRIVMDFYSIIFKKGSDCDIRYGRNYYDFTEGSLVFISPGQVSVAEFRSDSASVEGWMLCIHPDFISGTSLGGKIDEYTFFYYEVNEALHLSEKEKTIIDNTLENIYHEMCQNIDDHSQEVMLSNIELLLNYSKRFYSRQFITRSISNKDLLSRFNKLLRDYFQSNEIEEKRLPTVKELAKRMGYSTNYLSDLLKKETGKNTKEHINLHLLDRAKNLLLGTDKSVNEIALMLGFEYSNHFSRFFKEKTGMSPKAYRDELN